MAVRPLRPATDRRLGGPLPHQLANRARAPLQARGPKIPPFNNCHHAVPLRYAVLASLSGRYPPLEGRSPTCYSPVRHSTQSRSPFRVRLACVRHAASVGSEPGSNSHVKCAVSHFAVRSNSLTQAPVDLALALFVCRCCLSAFTALRQLQRDKLTLDGSYLCVLARTI